MGTYRSLVDQAEEYFLLRRKLGFHPRTERDEVLHFARRVDQLRPPKINLETVVNWARDSRRGSRRYVAHRYEAVRRFLAAIAGARPGITVPPPGFLGKRFVRRAVHIYSPSEFQSLMEASLTMPPVESLRPHTLRTAWGLLDAVGLRIGELLNLDVPDIDLEAGTLFIRKSKGGRSRLLPLQPSTVEALRDYSSRRRRRHPTPKTQAFFLTESRGTRLQYQTVTTNFRELRRSLGWTMNPAPRVHDFRHTFITRVLLGWIQAGKNIDAEMPALSAYVGHVHPESTYWYLTAIPELSRLITGSLERVRIVGERS